LEEAKNKEEHESDSSPESIVDYDDDGSEVESEEESE